MTAWIALALIATVIAGVVYQAMGRARDARRFPPPGELVDVGGCRLHVVCRGEGAPLVVLESAIAASSVSWSRVQPEVARFTRVCAYDRTGLGWSDASAARPTLSRVVSNLHAILSSRQGTDGFVLVGHSFGVFICLAYAAQHRHEVRGLVLVDPPSEWTAMDARQAYLLRGAVQLSRLGGWLARIGVVRACLALLTGGVPAAPRNFVKVFGPTTAGTLERLVGEVRKLPPELHPIVQATWCQPKCFRGMAEQLQVFQEAAASAAVSSPIADDVPLVVISGGDQPDAVIASHRRLAQSSSRGRHVVAVKSGHWIPFDEPELVVEAIREVVDAARQRAPRTR